MWTTDVLAAFYPAMCKRFGQPCNRINIWDGEGEAYFVKKNFHIVEKNYRFWLNLEKVSNPLDITFNFDYYITASASSNKATREEWLYNNGFPVKPVICSTDKVVDMRRLGVNVLIDDNPTTLTYVKEAGLIPIQFVPPYMSDERPELNPIRHLSQVDEVIKNINKI